MWSLRVTAARAANTGPAVVPAHDVLYFGTLPLRDPRSRCASQRLRPRSNPPAVREPSSSRVAWTFAALSYRGGYCWGAQTSAVLGVAVLDPTKRSIWVAAVPGMLWQSLFSLPALDTHCPVVPSRLTQNVGALPDWSGQ